MAEHQKIHPVDVEAPSQAAPLVPPELSRSDKGDPAAVAGQYPPYRRTIPISHSRPPKRRRSCCCKCVCCTILTTIILIILVAATLGILYLIFDPKLPKYSVDRLAVSAFTVDTNLTAHASFDVTVTAENPNKGIGIYYEGGSHLSVWYSGFSLCEGVFPEFYQGHRNTTVLTVVMKGEAQLGSTEMAALQQQQTTGMVPLDFKGDVPVRVKLGSLKLWKVTSRVRCNLVVDSLTANNRIQIRSSSCKFRLKL
uniref:NDR1/HIN1-like protein 6 n=1 Tax=Elaeis guineensis var. tenera TaxID=51953 RepID=A0A6I9QYK2_ELAGV|nr:NDR1/HIN1-like protein 6 [Elaeis guineensis]